MFKAKVSFIDSQSPVPQIVDSDLEETSQSGSQTSQKTTESQKRGFDLPEGKHLADLEPGSYFGHLSLEHKKNKPKELTAFA